ncbi:MAG: hypothetical protein JW749_04345 [Sedimentisphaerales bacterium]|nr:hypothetical protein [Sedimentisphaerales bacterium]
MTDIIKQVSRKQVRLGLLCNNSFVNFCTMGFTGDNTLIFASKFHIKKGLIEIGTSTSHQGRLIDQKKEAEFEIKNGFHISLHPKGQVMHLRENPIGKILSEKRFDWFPVKKPFHFLSLFSPPLDECVGSQRLSPFLAPAPKGYKNSILMKVDIFPKNTTQHFPYSTSIWMFWGYCPEYFVRASFLLTNHRVSPMVFWPIDHGFLNEGANLKP